MIFLVTILYLFSISKALTIHRIVRTTSLARIFQFQNFERSHFSLKSTEIKEPQILVTNSSQSSSGNFLGNFFKSEPVKETTPQLGI